MGKPGRKSWTEELQIAEKYSALSQPFFKFLLKMQKSKKLEDQKWAAERIEKAYVKMIPTDLTTGGEKIEINITAFEGIKHAEDNHTA